MSIVPLVSKPVGSGYEGEGPDWSLGSNGLIHAAESYGAAITCELCGTQHAEIDTLEVDWEGDVDGDNYSYHTFELLGRTVVYECCGRIIDHLFDEMGEMFAHEFLKVTADDPTSGEHRYLLSSINYYLRLSKSVLDETAKEVAEAQTQAGQLEQSLKS